jgi:hypothetical protein
MESVNERSSEQSDRLRTSRVRSARAGGINHRAALIDSLESRWMFAITFNITFDSSFTKLTNYKNGEIAFKYAASQLGALTGKSVTINLDVFGASGTGNPGADTSGENSPSFLTVPYATLRSELLADDSSLEFASSDPISGTHQWAFTTAEAKELGYSATYPTYDDTLYFGTGINYNFSTTNRAVAGFYDFVGVAEHEISEGMGRVAGLGEIFSNGIPTYTPLDLFRVAYNGSTWSHVYTAVDSYFSTDNGTNYLSNQEFNSQAGLDYGDWYFHPPETYDACDAQVPYGVQLNFGDDNVMNALGYD